CPASALRAHPLCDSVPLVAPTHAQAARPASTRLRTAAMRSAGRASNAIVSSGHRVARMRLSWRSPARVIAGREGGVLQSLADHFAKLKRIGIHAIGDRAVRTVLDAYERVI